MNALSGALAAWLFPLLASVLGLLLRRRGRVCEAISLAAQILAFVGALIAALPLLAGGEAAPDAALSWLRFPGTTLAFGMGLRLDGLAAAMLLVVHGLGLAVLVFSRWYLHGDRFYGRYFASFSFFLFAMSGVVLASSLLQAFVFWELVGLGSYLLIGHWHDKPAASDDPAYQAGRPFHAVGVDEKRLSPAHAQLKAFLYNRVGDFGFLSGLALFAAVVGGSPVFDGGDPLAWDVLFRAVAAGAFSGTVVFGLSGNALLTLAGILVFLGAMGKSAQFPLHVWLPEAMQGPTTASSIIHAATMVAAGVFLVARLYPAFTPEALLFVQWIGAITAFVAATIACVQWDYKAVLAYSTVSQLGFMMVGLGSGPAAGGFEAGTAHLLTHALFKCLLFLGAASVIHGMGGVQDLGRMGGLARRMPVTAVATGLATLAILGVPFFSAFWSKDAILAAAQAHAVLSGYAWSALAPWLLTLLAAGLTAYYMVRQWCLAFLGRPRDPELSAHAHDPVLSARIVLVVLAVFTLQPLWTGSLNPFQSESWLGKVLEFRSEGLLGFLARAPEELLHQVHLSTIVSTLVVLLGGAALALWLHVADPARGGHQAETLRRRGPTALLWNFLARLWLVDAILTRGLGRFVGVFGGRAVAAADLGSTVSLDRLVDGGASGFGLLGRISNLFLAGRIGAYAGWTALAFFGSLALFLLF